MRMAWSKIIRLGLLALGLVILLSASFLAGMGNTRLLQEAAYQAGYAHGLATSEDAAPAPAAETERAPELLTVSGSVTAVSPQAIDIRAEDGTAHAYRLDAETTFLAILPSTDPTAEPRQQAITAADVSIGDVVTVTRVEEDDRAATVVRTMRAADVPEPEQEQVVPIDPEPPEMVQPQ